MDKLLNKIYFYKFTFYQFKSSCFVNKISNLLHFTYFQKMAAAAGLQRFDLINIKCDFVHAFITKDINNTYFEFVPSFEIRAHKFPDDITISGESDIYKITIPSFDVGTQNMNVTYKF